MDFVRKLQAFATLVGARWRIIAALLVLVGLVLTVPRSRKAHFAKSDSSASVDVRAEVDVRADRPATAPGAYRWPPSVGSYPQPESHFLTVVRFTKTDGPWNAQESKFDLWFDGDVEPAFESRGFESPVVFNVLIPEPRHLSITVSTPPLEAANYIAFSFKSEKAVALVRSEAAPKLVPDGGSR